MGFFCSDGKMTSLSNLTVSTNLTQIETCDKTYQQTQMMGTFSISIAVMPVSAFFLGTVTGKLGTVVVRIILHVFWLIGIALFFLAQPGSSDYLVTVGCCFLTISGLNMAITNYPSSHLSGDKHGTVLSVMCGAFDESAAMGTILYSLYKMLGFHVAFGILVVLSSIMMVRTLTLMPKTIFPFHVNDDYQVDSVFCGPEKGGPVFEVLRFRSMRFRSIYTVSKCTSETGKISKPYTSKTGRLRNRIKSKKFFHTFHELSILTNWPFVSPDIS